MSTSETLRRDRQRKQQRDEERDRNRRQREQQAAEESLDEVVGQQFDEKPSETRHDRNKRRRQHIAEMREQALATVKAAGHRRILRLAEVEAITGKKRSAIYDGIDAGTFPKPISLGERTVGWLETEVMDWVEARIAERDKAAA